MILIIHKDLIRKIIKMNFWKNLHKNGINYKIIFIKEINQKIRFINKKIQK